MRQFTGRNFSVLIKDELVRRFEEIVKEEIRAHNIAIAKTDKELQYIKEIVEGLKKYYASMQADNVSLYRETNAAFENKCCNIDENLRKNRESIAENTKYLESVVNKLNKKIDELVDKEDLTCLRNDMGCNFDRAYEDFQRTEDKLNEYIFFVKKSADKVILSNHEENLVEHNELRKSIDSLSKKVESNKVDYEGILKELLVYKKSMFIIEKKIENIYRILENIAK